MVQVVNYEEQFNEQIESFLKLQNIAQLGFDYHVAAIMGPQSSGKSTLLNLLFGTQFRTMDESSGRYQVTQGVWMGRDSEAGIIVMDLEGTDSRERGEDATTFERKSALLALALSEVLIVNVWAQDVGRYNAANLALLKTVMELDLQLFFGSKNPATTKNSEKRVHKTRMLFVLRDHVSSPFETLCSTLKADVDNIWNTIAKPDAALGTPVTDYFDLDFFALPHKILMEEQFRVKGAELRRRFQEGEVFREEYRRGVAADGFAEYARSVWETIRANKELDIPSQKEMLAHVRCEQIAKDALGNIDTAFAPLKSALLPSNIDKAQTVPNLFQTLFTESNSALDQYQAAACRYSKTVADMKASDLSSRISTECKDLFDSQISVSSDAAIKYFRTEVTGSSDSAEASASWQNWGEVAKSAMNASIKIFDDSCSTQHDDESNASIEDGHPLQSVVTSASAARKRLSGTLQLELERANSDVLSAARNHCLKTFRDGFKPALLTVLDHASEDVWERASEVGGSAWDATMIEAQKVYGEKGLGFDQEKLGQAVEDDIKPACYENALLDIKDALGTPSNFLMRITKRFDDSFRFDERGVPRHFGPNDDLEALFIAAVEKGEKLVDLLSEVHLKGPLTSLRENARAIDPDISRPTIFEKHSREDLRERLKKQAGAVFMDARRAQEAAKITTKIPIWLIFVLVILGWNEFMAVLRNPLLLVLTIIILPTAYLAYTLDAPTLLGPAVRATLQPILEQVKQFLDQATAPPPDVVSSTNLNVPLQGASSVASAASTNLSSSSSIDRKE